MNNLFTDFFAYLLIGFLCGIIGFFIGIGYAKNNAYTEDNTPIGSMVFNSQTIVTDTMYVNDHRYIVFKEGDDILHIEHDPDCDCFTVEYD